MSRAAPSPTISVVMAAYNGADIIGETIASLQAQTFADFEVVIVEDCSTDNTLAVLRQIDDPRFRIIAAPVNQGVIASRNQAVAATRGRYIAGLDHDDLCHPERFARQVAYLDAQPQIVLVGTAANNVEDGVVSPSRLVPVSTPAVIEWLMRIENPLVWSSTMMRGDAARALDQFTRPEMIFAEDFDLYHRIATHGRIARIDDALVTYRRLPGSASRSNEARMYARTADILAGAYRDVLGDEAHAAATLIVRHGMAHEPVPDQAVLRRIGDILVTLQTDFLERHRPDPHSRALIRWETARRWAMIGRVALRSGALGLAETAVVRPHHLGLGYAGVEELILSRLVGTARSVQRRYQAIRASEVKSVAGR